MKAVHQVVPSVVAGDAVTSQALAWQGLLRLWGHEGGVIADHVRAGFGGRVYRLNDSRGLIRRADAVVVHYSLWTPAWTMVLETAASIVLCYHNVTPGHLIRKFNPRIADLCDQGRSNLVRFAGRTSAVVADSAYNAREVEELGIGPAQVVPLLLNVAPNGAADREPGGSVVLTVGRVAPSKQLDSLILAFAEYQRVHEPEASLVLVGPDEGFEGYRAMLDAFVRRVGVRRVSFTGRVSREELDAWYRTATVFASTSAHEGFCAPLIEAMAHDLPVVAVDSGAMPETIADAGLVVTERDPAVFAAALNEAASSPELRAQLIAAGRRRANDFAPEAVAARLREALEPVLA
jgi:L-malate glycosyltransferase